MELYKDLYKVEAILGKRTNPFSRRTEYRVKWLGYPEEEATCHLRELINEFEAERSLSKVTQPKSTSQIHKSSHIFDSPQSMLRKHDSPPQPQLSQQESKSRQTHKKKIRKPSKGEKVAGQNKNTAKGLRKAKPQGTPQEKPVDSLQNDKHGKASEGIQEVQRSIREREEVKGSQEGRIYREERNLEEQEEKLENGEKEEKEERSVEKVLHLEGQEPPRDEHFLIKELCRRNETFIYLVQEHGQTRWASKNEIVREHPLALIEFYEHRIKYSPKDRLSTPLPLLPK